MLTRMLALAALALAATAVQAAAPPALTVEYAADRRIETADATLEGSVFAAPGRERTELRMGAISTVLILRTDRRIGWMLMPAQKMYNELNFAQAAQQSGAVPDDQVELEEVGEEAVSGLQTTKYKFVTRDKGAGGYLWYSAEGIPVKMDVVSKSGRDKSRMTVTLENIRIGSQDPALFEVPSGYSALPGGKFFSLPGLGGRS
jgi:outer membrane lipoprotein-sorting protein